MKPHSVLQGPVFPGWLRLAPVGPGWPRLAPVGLGWPRLAPGLLGLLWVGEQAVLRAGVVLPEDLLHLVQLRGQRQPDVQVHLQVLQPLLQLREGRSGERDVLCLYNVFTRRLHTFHTWFGGSGFECTGTGSSAIQGLWFGGLGFRVSWFRVQGLGVWWFRV